MNSKNVNSVLSKKFEDFLTSIQDEEVKKLISVNSILTGGCITSLLLGDKPSDYDIYFTNFETTYKVAQYYAKIIQTENKLKNLYGSDQKPEVIIQDMSKGLSQFDYDSKLMTDYFSEGSKFADPRIKIFIKSSGVLTSPESVLNIENQEEQLDSLIGKLEPMIESDKKSYRPVFVTSNAITLSDKIQIILRFFGNPGEIHKNFDFVHCTNYWLSKNHQLVLNQQALESILAKELRYVGSKYPIASILRFKKFFKRGWYINAGQTLKILFQISQLDLTDIAVLKEQLIGVDVAYFMQLIHMLIEDKAKNPALIVDSNYLVSIIDRIF